MTRHPRRGLEGRATGLVVLLLLALCGAGAWNYHRNLAAEEAERARRPLAGYETSDLESLAKAYEEEVATLQGHWDGVRSSRTGAQDRGFVGDQIDEYERVRRASEAKREVGAKLAVAESSLHDVQEELDIRRHEQAAGWWIHLRRLVSI